MDNIVIKISSNDGQTVSGGLFFSISKENNKCCKKEVIEKGIMENKDIATIKISKYKIVANYAYDLFQVFDNKYKAAPIKVQKLLFISEMVSKQHYKKSIFPDDVIFECNACGFKIPTFTDYIKDFISNGEIGNEIIIPTNDEILKINNLKTIYVLNGLETESADVIADTVIAFGKFNPITLGELLNDFKNNSNYILFKQQPPFTFTKKDFELLLQNLENLKGKNAIADFILSYDKQTENNS